MQCCLCVTSWAARHTKMLRAVTDCEFVIISVGGYHSIHLVDMVLTEFVIVVSVVTVGVIATGIASLCFLRRPISISPLVLGGVGVMFGLMLVGAHMITAGATKAINAAVDVMESGPVIANALREVDSATECTVPTKIIADAEAYTYDLKVTADAIEESSIVIVWSMFASFAASALLAIAISAHGRFCTQCCGLSTAVPPMMLAAIAGVLVAAGTRAVCTAYIEAEELSSDLRYLVDPSAPDTGARLLQETDIAQFTTATCTGALLAPIERFQQPGVFYDEYTDVDRGVCTEMFTGGIVVVALAWLSLVALGAAAWFSPAGASGKLGMLLL